MCDPVTMAVVAAGIGATSAIRQGNMQAAAANRNADLAVQRAGVVNAQATTRQELQRQQARVVIGEQLASTAQSGTGLNGSNLDLLNQSLGNAQSDALQLRYGADLESNGLNQQAQLDRAQASQARTSGYLSAAGSLVGASSSYLRQGGTIPGFDTGNFRSDGNGMFETGPMSPDWQRRLERRSNGYGG